MSESYYHYWKGKWYWWSASADDWSETDDGKRYPEVTIVILTEKSFDFALGVERLMDTEDRRPPGMDPVTLIKNMERWELDWDQVAPYKRLLVYEFFEKNSSPCKAMDKPLEKLATKYGRADFRKLDVDNFEFLARLCGVEGAYPTFVLFENCRQVGKVVGVKEDDLEQSIQRALPLTEQTLPIESISS